MFYFFLASLAVWRICSLLSYEVGPYKIFEKLRKATKKYNWINLDCFMCISVQVSFLMAFALDGNFLINMLALSAVSIVIDRLME